MVMRQALLADRFKLTTHSETRQLPVYALIVAKKSGTLRPRLKPSSQRCGDPTKPAGQLAPGQTPCGMSGGSGRLDGRGITMAELAYYLSFVADRVVLDNTGLSEAFDLNLEWTLEPLTAESSAGGLRSGAGDGLAGSGPSLFTAVQEHLGLKLDPQTGPVAVLVIDRAEKPSED
jgi:bla regulator protein BlaR1